MGGLTGTGWRKGEFSGRGWLPTPYTDSVFSAFGEEFGFLGILLLIVLYYALLFLSFSSDSSSSRPFGRLLAAGVAVYLAMHVLVKHGNDEWFLTYHRRSFNTFSYGGSSILSTMMALGILQSIYSRRFMF